MYKKSEKKPYVSPILTVVVFRPERGLLNSGLGPDPATSSINIESRVDNGATWAATDASQSDQGWIY